jgi:excisionase family DNA binding protein
LLTVAEACASLRISRWMLYRLIHARRLKTVKIGSARRVPAAALHEFVEDLRGHEGDQP